MHKPKRENYDITNIRTANESHLHWKNHFHKNSFYFRIYANFEADNEIDSCNIGKKTTNTYKQNPVPNGYHIESELEYILQSSS